MGAFFLVRRNGQADYERVLESLSGAFAGQGFNAPENISTPALDIYLYTKQNTKETAPVHQLFYRDPQNFALLVGTALYRGRHGSAAAKALFEHFSFETPDWREFSGDFCAIVCRDGAIRLFSDRLGIYKVYRESTDTVFSSSFLAMLETVRNPAIDSQSVYEYVFQVATYGNKTGMSAIELIDSDGAYCLDKQVSFQPWADRLVAEINPAPIGEHVQRSLDNLRRLFGRIARCFEHNINTALSGGYDSRLALALLWEQGVRPKSIHVYGSDNDDDVKVARHIADKEKFVLIHVNKSRAQRMRTDEFPDVIARNLQALDGFPPDGIFDNGTDVRTRRERCTEGELMLNGGGGTIFRNPYYLLNYRFSVRQFLWSFYNRYDPLMCTKFFSESAYLKELGRRISGVLGQERTRFSRAEIELLYVYVRCRYWMGKNNSINNRLSWTLTPFVDYAIVRDSITIPIAYKNHGRLEAALIRAINPALAHYSSAYGHDFSSEPPLSRVVKDYSTFLRPSFVRRYTYRIRNRWGNWRKAHPYYLDESYLRTVVDVDFPYMSGFFQIDQLREAGAYNRCCTLEYLFQTYNVGQGLRLT
jgi:asparagine synthase (glutamine-hydrolysing)